MVQFADAFSLPFGPATFGNRFGIHDIVNGKDLYGPQGHRGTDFKVGTDTPVPVIANGVVEHLLHSEALGNVVVVRHYLHGDNNDVYSGYCHLNSVSVKQGQPVARGAIIAKSGMTGTAATGPHLHLTLSTDDTGVISGPVQDPITFIQSWKPAQPASFSPKYTTAKKGEGLIRIANRSHISFDAIKKLNPKITAPDYLVRLGQSVRIK